MKIPALAQVILFVLGTAVAQGQETNAAPTAAESVPAQTAVEPAEQSPAPPAPSAAEPAGPVKIYQACSFSVDLTYSPGTSFYKTDSLEYKTNHFSPAPYDPFNVYNYREQGANQRIGGSLTLYFKGVPHQGYWPVFYDDFLLRPSTFSIGYSKTPGNGTWNYFMSEKYYYSLPFPPFNFSFDYAEKAKGSWANSGTALDLGADIVLSPLWDLAVQAGAFDQNSLSSESYTNTPNYFTNRYSSDILSGTISIRCQPVQWLRVMLTGSWDREADDSRRAHVTTNTVYATSKSSYLDQQYRVSVHGVLPVRARMINGLPGFFASARDTRSS